MITSRTLASQNPEFVRSSQRFRFALPNLRSYLVSQGTSVGSQLLFFNSPQQKFTPFKLVYLQKICNFIVRLQSYCLQVKKKNLIQWLYVKKKQIVRGKNEGRIFFIILLDSLYYFVKLYVKIKIEMQGLHSTSAFSYTKLLLNI